MNSRKARACRWTWPTCRHTGTGTGPSATHRHGRPQARPGFLLP